MALAVVFFVAAYLAIAQPFDFSGSRENPELPDTDISTAGFDIIADEDQRLILHLKPSFIVNLDGLDGRFVMKVLVQLEVNNLALVDELNNNTAKYYRMIDELLTTMKTYSYSELVYRGGVTRLKEELRRRLNRNLQSGSIVRVIFKQLYFSEQLPRRLVPAR